MSSEAQLGKRVSVGSDPGQAPTQHACIGPKKFHARETAANAYFAKAIIQGEPVHALVDSGAMATMISETFCETLPVDTFIDQVRPDQIQYEGIVAGSKLNIVGTILVPIKIGNFESEPHKILVVAGTYSPCILGLDFLDKYYISIDAGNRKLLVNPPGLECSTIDLVPHFISSKGVYRASSTTRVEIAPRSISLIQVSIKNLGEDMEGCIEGLESDDMKFMVPRSLHSIKEGLTYIDCVNITDRPIAIQRDQKVGIFTPMNQLRPLQADGEQRQAEIKADSKASDLFNLNDS